MRAVLIACRIALATLWLALTLAVATAQEAIDYAEWRQVSSEIEALLAEDELPRQALNALRDAASDWRGRFLDGTRINADEIDTINAQIAALGPPPGEGQTEAQDIATRRAELNEALAAVRAPRIEAVTALAEANALIARIDARFRAQQTDAFFQLQRSPLLPSQWLDALSHISDVTRRAGSEVASNMSRLRTEEEIAKRLPLSLLLLSIAIILIARGPYVTDRLVRRVEQNTSEHGRVVYGYLVSLGGIALPMVGVSLINAALISTGILGPVGRAVALGINIGIVLYAISRWLAARLYPERDLTPTPINLNESRRSRGRRLSRIAGILLGVLILVEIIDRASGFDPQRVSVIVFPVFVLLGVALFEIGRLARAGRPSGGDAMGYSGYLLGIAGRALQAVGVIGPVLAAIGYYNMAKGILVPTTLTLGVAAFLVTFHYVVRAAYGLLRGLSVDEAEDALVPILISFVLTFVTVPFASLFWGVRMADLADLWTEFKTGVQVGETTISPVDFLTVLVVFGIGYALTRLVQGLMRTTVLPRTTLDKGGQNAAVSGLGYVGITLAALAGVTAAGIDLSSFAIIVGALSVGIGFGMQNIVNNFVSGIILLIERPISEGDWVDVNGNFGIVKSISVRSTIIETFDRTDVIVPNGDLVSGIVTNWTRGNTIGRVIVPVGVAYGTDTRKVEQILKDVAEAHPIVAVNPAPVVLFRGFGASSLDFEIRAILTDVSYIVVVQSDLNHEIARRFAEEGIEIPFAQQDIWFRNPETLRGTVAEPAASEPDTGGSTAGIVRPDPGLREPDSGEGDD